MKKSEARKLSKKIKKRSKIGYILIFLLGLLIMIYPHISDWYYTIQSNAIVEYFDEEKEKMSDEELKRRIDLAKAFNLSLHNLITTDPYSEDQKENGKKEYARMLEIKEYIGHVEIPAINQDLPIFAGTTEEVLQKGVGHLEGTSLPVGGINTHTVLTAHTGIPKAKLFTDLEKVKEKDVFYIHNIEGVLAYEIDQIKVVEPSHFEDLLIQKDQDYATLLTCTPYGINTHRLLVRGHRIAYYPSKQSKKPFLKKATDWYMVLVTILLLGVFVFVLWKKKKKKEQQYEKTSGKTQNNTVQK